MKDTDFIFNWTEDFKKETLQLQFASNDIRLDFFYLIYDIAYCFYRGYIFLDLAEFTQNGQIIFKNHIFNDYKKHLDRVKETSQNQDLVNSHINSLNRALIIDAWSVFEYCITILCDGLCDEIEKQKLLNHQYNEIISKLGSLQLTDKINNELKKILVKEHMAHVPITRKTDLVFKRAKNYYRDIKSDKEFLKFFGKLRNSLHSNFIYYGNDYTYDFGQAHFIFKNEKSIEWTNPFGDSPKLFFYIVGELKNVWKTLILSIENKVVIQSPD